MALGIATHEILLASGEIVPVGMNFYALELMTRYPGGLNKLKRDMEKITLVDEDSDEHGELMSAALHGLSHMLWALVRAGGTQCTKEECAMAIGIEDFQEIHEIFTEFMRRADKMTAGKNVQGLTGATK